MAHEIYLLSKKFPKEERYSLTDQFRRSSRSVCANLAEGFRKRRYHGAFVSKLSDAEAEAAECQVWSEFALASGYIAETEFERLFTEYERVIAQLVVMIDQPEKWALNRV